MSICLESKTSTLLSSSPKYKNTKLEQKINENKDKSELWLNRLSLTDNDMEIVAYYLLQINKVSHVVFVFLLLKSRGQVSRIIEIHSQKLVVI
jgi:hypothetical protein